MDDERNAPNLKETTVMAYSLHEIEQLKVGQEVAWCYRHYGTLLRHGFGVITKINGRGEITVQTEVDTVTRTFNKRGEDKADGSKFHCMRLTDPVALRASIEEDKANRETRKVAVDCEAAIHATVHGGRCNASPEAIELMKKLTELLRTAN